MKVIVIGGGQVGSYLASLLISNGHEVKVVEHREKVFAKLEKEFPKEMLLFGNGSDPAVLEKAGINEAQAAAAVTGADEVNLVVSTLAKMEFAVPRVIARVNNPKNKWLFNPTMGVDVGVNQADIMGHFVMEEMDLKSMFTLFKLNRGDYSIVQINVSENAPAEEKLVKNLAIPQKTVLIAINRQSKTIIPKGDTKIMAGDEILLLTDDDSRKVLNDMFG
ncbi:MAG: TrkA family potassium uptake protein [Lacrimispora sp.]